MKAVLIFDVHFVTKRFEYEGRSIGYTGHYVNYVKIPMPLSFSGRTLAW